MEERYKRLFIEAKPSDCSKKGQKYSKSADMCYKPCGKGKIFDPKSRKCISLAKEEIEETEIGPCGCPCDECPKKLNCQNFGSDE